MITYMAEVPSGTNITEWMPGTDAVFFKVAEAGKTADGLWAATDIPSANDSIYTFTIPASLKPGQYIVRHEIIALHASVLYSLQLSERYLTYFLTALILTRAYWK